MKVGEFSNTEIEGDDFEGMDASIDKKNLSFLFDIVSKQMYRRPIPSIVREITSNCFDSHVEANVSDPVVISLSRDDGGYFISFTDVGVGMSPERMKKVYSKWFSSTKRDSNDQIGMFGLGSKSPLAYVDSFYLTTIHDNVKYEYTIHKGQKTPRIDLIIQDECIDRNQTEVKIYIKDYSDAQLFKEACQSQLAYFDNVYIDSDVFRFNNVYTILDYNTFKYREDYQYSNNLHILIGKVPYPIAWEEVEMDPIRLPLGIKFNIGDLQVTPERESIRYIELKDSAGNVRHTRDIVKEKINAVLYEVRSLYESTVDPNFDDYSSYRSYIEDTRAYLKVGRSTIDVTDYVDKPSAVFTPLKDFQGKLPKNLFSDYHIVARYHVGSKPRLYRYPVVLDEGQLRGTLCVIAPSSGKFNVKKTAYLFDQALSLTGSASFNLIAKREHNSVGLTIKQLGIRINCKHYNYEETSATRQYKLFSNYVFNEINRLTLDYDLIELPADWLAKYNLEHKRKVNKEDDQILVYNYGKSTLSAGKEYINPAELVDFTGFIVYGFDKHEELLKNYRELFILSKYGAGGRDIFNNYEIHSKRCRLYKIAQRNEKYFLTLKNAVFVEDFMGNNKIFKKFATAALIDDNCKAVKMTGVRFPAVSQKPTSMDFLSTMEVIFPPVAEVIRELKETCEDYGSLAYNRGNGEEAAIANSFFNEMKAVAREYDLYDKDTYEAYLKVERYVEGLDLLNYVAFESAIIPLVVDFLLLKGKKIDPLWTNGNSYELDLINDSLAKISYNLSVYTQPNYVPCGKVLQSNGDIVTPYASKDRARKTGLSSADLEVRIKEYQKHLVVYQAIKKHHGTHQESNQATVNG